MRILSSESAIAVACRALIILLCIIPPKVQADEVMVFISFSMPIESIKQWFASSNKNQIPVLLRGLKNNSLKETVQFLQSNFDPIPNNLLIDPERFEYYQIKKVPAVVVVHANTFDVIYGDQSLENALEKIRAHHD